MRKMLLLASVFFAACSGGGDHPITGITPTCTGGINPSQQASIRAGETLQVSWSFQNCTSTLMKAGDAPSVTVSPSGVLPISPTTTTTYIFTASDNAGHQVVVQLLVTVLQKPVMKIDASTIPDTGIVLRSSAWRFNVAMQNVATCSKPRSNQTPAQADTGATRASVFLSGTTLTYTPGDAFSPMVNGKRIGWIALACTGQDGSGVSDSLVFREIAPTLKCTSMTPDSVKIGWVGNTDFACGSTTYASNGVDSQGTVLATLVDLSQSCASATDWVMNPGWFQRSGPYRVPTMTGGTGSGSTLRMITCLKNPERPEAPLGFTFTMTP